MQQYHNPTTGRTLSCPCTVTLPSGARVSNPTEAQFAEAGYLPYTPPVEPPPALEQVKAERMSEFAADYQRAVDAALPVPTRLEIEAGLREPGGMDSYQNALLDFRAVYSAAAGEIAVASDAAAVAAVAWTWPTVEVL